MVLACERAGVRFCVNQNMRYDHSIRALKTVLRRGYLGEPVLATVDMRAIPHWQPWAKDYGKVTLAFMSIHHLDSFRYLFGDPEFVYASARHDPRLDFPHRDGIVLYILEYANGMRAAAWDDTWTGPAREGGASDIYIKWRVEGTDGNGARHHRMAGISRPRSQHHPVHHRRAARLLVLTYLAASLVSRRLRGHHGRTPVQPGGGQGICP